MKALTGGRKMPRELPAGDPAHFLWRAWEQAAERVERSTETLQFYQRQEQVLREALILREGHTNGA